MHEASSSCVCKENTVNISTVAASGFTAGSYHQIMLIDDVIKVDLGVSDGVSIRSTTLSLLQLSDFH